MLRLSMYIQGREEMEMTTTPETMTETMQWSRQCSRRTGRVIGGYVFAAAAAEQIRTLGHPAEAHRGPVSVQGPDDEAREGDTYGHIHTTPEGRAAYRTWQASVRG